MGRVIVNADDFGAFRCVSRGIVDAAQDGVVRATGVMACAPDLEWHVRLLEEIPHVDVGVHLDLTRGPPLTEELRLHALWRGGNAPSAARVIAAVLRGALATSVVEEEWRAQIRRCRSFGIVPRFLNSHEHVHALPALHAVALRLAAEHGIRHVRVPRPAEPASYESAAAFRHAALAFVCRGARDVGGVAARPFLGLAASGRLDVPALLAHIDTAARLGASSGRVPELMCHPGRFDADEVREPRLLRYHDWQQELRTLCDPVVREAAAASGVEFVGYRDLARPAAAPVEQHAAVA
mgnify:CR=1 FL=1